MSDRGAFYCSFIWNVIKNRHYSSSVDSPCVCDGTKFFLTVLNYVIIYQYLFQDDFSMNEIFLTDFWKFLLTTSSYIYKSFMRPSDLQKGIELLVQKTSVGFELE